MDNNDAKIRRGQADDRSKVVIHVTDLHKIYKVGTTQVRALNGVDFDVQEGEFCAIVGTSGSGKSTLLNMLLSLKKVPTETELPFIRIIPIPPRERLLASVRDAEKTSMRVRKTTIAKAVRTDADLPFGKRINS